LVAIYAALTAFQSYQSKRSADAATSAANTASQALHVAERAHLSIATPTYDSKKLITFQIVNTGHLHAEDVKVTVYRLAINSATPGTIQHTLSDVVDIGKNEVRIPSIPSGLNSEIDVVFNNLDPTRTGINGTQLVVVGSASYNTGFRDEPRQTLPFCLHSEWELQARRLALAPCNVDDYSPTIKTIISHRAKEKP